MVADALSCKAVTTLVRDVCVRMTMITPILEKIQEDQVEAMKEEHWESEHIVRHVASFDYDSRWLLTLHRRMWLPYRGGARQVLMEEAHNSRLSIHPGVTKMYRDLWLDY